LMAKNYETLGNMNFDNTLYRDAGQYYDSTMGKLVLDSKEYRTIKRKRDNLEDVIYYENIAQVNDSILNLVSLPEADRLAYFESFVEILKIKAEEEKEKLEALERNQGLVTVNNNQGNVTPARIGGMPNVVTSFYFYNPSTVAYGKNEFRNVWGNRPLEDNWRWSSNSSSGTATALASETDVVAQASDEEKFDPHFYLSKIPSEEKEIDSISKERNYAYYQLGLIYKEKFKEYELAKNKLQNLLESSPEERLVLPAKYN